MIAERLTCALTDGLPSFCNRGQRYEKNPEPPKKFGKIFRKGAIFSLFFLSASYLFIKKVFQKQTKTLNLSTIFR